jgi:hypothetical protein
MAIADRNIDAPTKMAYYFGIMPNAIGTSAIVEAVQEYLAGWSKERISSLQKIDAGWAPFDADQRPLQINCTLDVRCIRDAIHCHCMSLSEAGVAPTPDLVEFDEFFFLATEMIENFERAALQAPAPAIRTPAIPSHRDVLENW